MMTEAEVMVSKRAVLDAAIELLENGFDAGMYFGGDAADGYRFEPDEPGPDVRYVCAIGGVEQALWKLTGEDVHEYRAELAYLVAPTFAASVIAEEDLDDTHLVYGQIMGLLNQTAFEFCRENRLQIQNIEQLTIGEHGKENVLTVFRRARELADA